MDAQVNLIQSFRNTILGKFLSIGIALYVLNVSIDSADATTFQGKENLTINDIESFAELIVEELIQVEDFFTEFDDQDSESTLQNTQFSFLGIPVSTLILDPVLFDHQPLRYDSYKLAPYFSCITITSPPPENV